MREKISQNIVNSVSDLLKVIGNSSREETNYKSTIETTSDLLYKLMIAYEGEFEETETSGALETRVKILETKIMVLCFISAVLRKIAAVFKKGVGISSLIESNSIVYLRLANEAVLVAVSYYIQRALKSSTDNKNKESVSYKNKATDLEYKMKNKIFDELVDQDATDFLNERLRSMELAGEGLVEKGFKTGDGQETIIYPDQIEIKSAYEPSRKKDWFNWSVQLEVKDNNIMNRIENVKYTLHPTFLENEKTATNPADRFRLEAIGWGEFEMIATIRFKDEKIDPITKYHWLDLGLGGTR